MQKAIRKYPILDNFSYGFKSKIKKKKLKNYFNKLNTGIVGFRSLKIRRVSFREIEAIRRFAAMGSNKSLKILFRVTLNKPLRAKAVGSRMGKGRSSICRWWVYNLQRGSIFFELDSFYSLLSYSLIGRLFVGLRRRFFSYSIIVYRYGLNSREELLNI